MSLGTSKFFIAPEMTTAHILPRPVVFQGSGEGFLSHRKGIVNWSDLPALDEEEWVNDELINFYML